MRHNWIVTIAVSQIVSCSESKPLDCQKRVASTILRESFAPPVPADILIAMDNSPSMVDELTRAHSAVTDLVDQLVLTPRPWRLGIITMDLESPSDAGRLREWPGGSMWAEWPPPPGADIDAARQGLLADIESVLLQIGAAGGQREAGLEAIRRAIDPSGPSEVVAHNDGFLRAEADLALAIITDEDDCSASDYVGDDGTDTWCAEAATLNSVSQYVDLLAGLKPEKGIRGVRAALIVGGAPTQDYHNLEPMGCYATPEGADDACGCWTNATGGDASACSYLAQLGHPCSASCDPECEALPGSRYLDFAKQIGDRRVELGYPTGFLQESICDPLPSLLRATCTVLLWDCVALPQPVLDPTLVHVEVHTRDPWTAEEKTGTLAHLADCNDCDECPLGAWQLVDPDTLCLTCGLSLEEVVEIEITVVTEITMSGEDC